MGLKLSYMVLKLSYMGLKVTYMGLKLTYMGLLLTDIDLNFGLISGTCWSISCRSRVNSGRFRVNPGHH